MWKETFLKGDLPRAKARTCGRRWFQICDPDLCSEGSCKPALGMSVGSIRYQARTITVLIFSEVVAASLPNPAQWIGQARILR